MANEILSKLSNQKITTYTEDGILYLRLEGETSVIQNNRKIPMKVIIPKISLQDLTISITNDEIREGFIRRVLSEDGSVTFKILPILSESKHWFIVEPLTINMTKEEIEKELGYKINIKE